VIGEFAGCRIPDIPSVVWSSELNPVETLEDIFRRDHGLVLSSLIKSFGDFDLAEEALADAVTSALTNWPRVGTPRNPAAWLLTVARRKAIDQLRRRRRLEEKVALLGGAEESMSMDGAELSIDDERLRLIFTCCHPALSRESQVALTLRSLGGLTTAEIARAFLTTEPTMFQRITRAKDKIRRAAIPYRVPSPDQLPQRLASVLAVVYLIFNEGYSTATGSELVRVDLCKEAIRLSETLVELLPNEPDVLGLAALCWLTEGRRPGRIDGKGDLVLLAEQDRGRWDLRAIERGLGLLRQLGGDDHESAYAIQANIAALHSTASSHASTDWKSIVRQYDRLIDLRPSPVVALNRAVAVAMAEGIDVGLALMDPLADALAAYQPFHAAQGELLARTGRNLEAAESYRRALTFSVNDVERRYLQQRLAAAERLNSG
jgi:RNA polymerase sigma-70 factor (ECF subfamily)